MEKDDEGREYKPFTYENGDTQRELAAVEHYLLYKSPEKQTEFRKTRARIIFGIYPRY